MATKTSIIADINTKIISNGNIRATDTNKILKDILNCDELNTTSSLQTFEFQANNVDIGIGIVSYSIKGFIGLFANITLEISIKESNSNVLNVPFDNKKIGESLATIIKSNNNVLDFLVKIRNKSTDKVYTTLKITPAKNFRIGNLNFGFNASLLRFSIESQEPNDKLFSGDSISTSFTIHNT